MTLLGRPRRFSADVCTAQHMDRYYVAKDPPPRPPKKNYRYTQFYLCNNLKQYNKSVRILIKQNCV